MSSDGNETIGLHSLSPAPGSRKPRKRVGRGHGSGIGARASAQLTKLLAGRERLGAGDGHALRIAQPGIATRQHPPRVDR